ncbi:conserved hypothetical protein [Sporisorium reilianum SRZ2]|uniref:Uncharacterized protein n=1 Tax=Sporisorium reilianum (strain SRZ2) TaxID=999809 RepID=E6ZVT8_SPORE|nr:conserved hypothetical protein [Sporisorium reilianum SRZ2]
MAESHAMDAGMSRAASRAGSISTLWSSAEVPLCLDPRVQPSSDTSDLYPSRNHSIATSISRNSARSSQVSIDFGRLSIDIPDEYPRRPDSIRLSPPRASASTSSSSSGGGSPSRVPSFNIGTIDENAPMQTSSPFSHFPYQPPSLGAQHRVLSSRFSEDTIDEPSQGTFGARLSVPRKSSLAVSDGSASGSSRSSSMQDTHASTQGRIQNTAQAPSELYRRAYRFFDKGYTVQPSPGSLPTGNSSAETTRAFNEQHRHDRPSLVGSDLSHEGSVPSCSRSQASTHASSSDSASACSAEECLSRSSASGPVIVTAEYAGAEAHLTPAASSRYDQRSPASTHKSDALGIPCLPSLPSFPSTLTATHTDHANEVRRRPSTADVYSQASQASQASQVSPHTLSSLPLPALSPMHSPTDPVRYQVQSYNMAPATSSNNASSPSNSRSTTSRLLRARVASTPKLRADANPLFGAEQALHLQHPVPPLPSRLDDAAADRRPSTAQMDGRAPFFGRRFRSRTLGESDRAEAANMQTATVNAASRALHPPVVSPQRPLVLSSMAPGSASMLSQRHPSQVSAVSSELHSPLYAMQPTPGSSICSASSPATTNSSLPVTPRTATAFPRPKSRGNGSASKTAGWASYLQSGLTLHLEGDHGRAYQVNMRYLAYDPFGRPEQLVEGTEAARVLTPKRPKSRGDKDQEAEQSGTLEFGPAFDDGLAFDMRRKADATAVLKHLTVGDDTRADLLTRQAALSLTTLGSHQVCGYERRGRLAWKLAYRVETDGGQKGGRRLVPVRFSCSATLLNPERARKSRLLNLVKKQMVPTLASKAVAGAEALDSPRSASYAYEEGVAATAASPASSRVSNRQLDPTSPVRRNVLANGVSGASSAYNSPVRQASRTTASASSTTSAESSFCSQPTTPARDAAAHPDSSMSRTHLLHASPLRSSASPTTGAAAPALQLDLGQQLDVNASSKRLQEKASLASLSVSSTSSGSVQHARPMVINGRKLIPISLPAGLARRSRIDPALLQANVVAGAPARAAESMHSSASSEHSLRRRVPSGTANGLKCLLASQPHSGTSSRPPTASETIKLEYLARTASPTSPEPHALRHQKSFGAAILTPSSFADAERRRRRSRTNDERLRPFTADAWGEAQYPTPEQQLRALSQQHHQHQQPEVQRGASFGSYSSVEEGMRALPAPPRPTSRGRPRTAQTITAASAAEEGQRGYVPLPQAQRVRS